MKSRILIDSFVIAGHRVPPVTTEIAIGLAIAFVIGLIAGLGLRKGIRRYRELREREIQNCAEAMLSRSLKTKFRPPDYHLLNHVTLRLEDGTTTQIDHILVSRFGIFVIETKDLSGWIFADAKQRKWTQALYHVKFRFQNPIHQNYRHVCAVRALLDFIEPELVRSAVVFSDQAEFKTGTPDGVFSLPEFLKHVETFRADVISINRLQFCVGRIEATRLAITEATDVEHVLELQRRHVSD